MRTTRRRVAATAATTAALIFIGSATAWAAVGLPYTGTITFISGGENGVGTPVFLTNSTGKVCVKPDLYVRTDAISGAQYNDNRYRVKVIRDLLVDRVDKTWDLDVTTDGTKLCTSGLDKNANYFVNVSKTKFVQENTLAGSAVITYS